MNKTLAFGYYGGKYSHLEWLLPLLPVNGIQHYCEPFAGSAAVLINRPPAPVETYNDLDGEVVNFFRVLRTQRDALLEQLCMTPFSRDEFAQAFNPIDGLSECERARRFYIRLGQIRGDVPNGLPSHWSYCVSFSKRGMGGAVSAFYGGLDRMLEVSERLLRVQIENLPALDIIGRYDTPETLFYVDPPYMHETRAECRSYRHEMDNQQHSELLRSLLSCRGKVALSGYENPLYMDTLSKWYLTRAPFRHVASSDSKAKQECLWTNYDPATVQNDLSGLPMFSEV